MPRPPLRPTVDRLEPRDVPAAVGGLDPSFGEAGVGPLFDLAGPVGFAALLAQPAGKVVAVGSTGGAGGGDLVAVRYTPGGQPDPTFGTSGRGFTVLDLGGADRVYGAAVDGAGNVVAVGESGGNFVVARLTAAGAPDATFGGTGVRAYDLGGADRASAVAFQSDGTVVVAGTSDGKAAGDPDPAVIRINPATAAQVGLTKFVEGAGAGAGAGVAVQPDNRIVVVGSAGADVLAARLSADLSEPPAVTWLSVPGVSAAAAAVAATPDGGFLVGGTAGGDFLLYRLRADLSADPGFGPGGYARFDLGGTDQAAGLVRQPDGRAVLVGTSGDQAAVLRVTADGRLDRSFAAATGGVRRVTAVGATTGAAVALTAGGRVAVGGAANGGADGYVARLGGTVEKGRRVAAGGAATGGAAVYAPDPAGRFPAAPSATAVGLGAGLTARPAAADVNGDGLPDTVLVSGPGTPLRFAVISGVDNAGPLVGLTAPFGGSEDFAGGGFVAVADFDADGRDELVFTPDQGGGPRVAVFSLGADGKLVRRADFLGLDDPAFRGGARAAAGDVNGDGVPDLAVAAGFGGGPRVSLFDGRGLFAGRGRLTADFFAFPGEDATRLRNGAFVAVGDVTGDGFGELIFGGGPGGAPRVFALSGARLTAGDLAGAYAGPVANFFVNADPADRGGARVAAVDADGDDRADVAAGAGPLAPSRVRVYPGAGFVSAAEPRGFQDLVPFGGAALADGVYVG